jgi:hypothetical protein
MVKTSIVPGEKLLGTLLFSAMLSHKWECNHASFS